MVDNSVTDNVSVPEGHTVVDHIYGPTLATLLGTSVLWRNTSVVPRIGRSGVWTSPLCPREFELSSKVVIFNNIKTVPGKYPVF